MAFLGILMHRFCKKYITSMSGMLFLMFVQSLFQFGAKVGKWERYYGAKIILTCPLSKKNTLKQLVEKQTFEWRTAIKHSLH